MAEKNSEKASETPKKRVAAKLFEDVKKPEDTPASATSKPVIVGHKSTIKDPMVAQEKSKEEKPELDPELENPEEFINDKPKSEIKIQPISEEIETDTKKSEENKENTAEEPKQEAPEEVPSEDQDKTIDESTDKEETENSPNTPNTENTDVVDSEETGKDSEQSVEEEVKDDDAPLENDSSSAVDSIVENISTQKERDIATEKQQVVENEVNELITSKKYNVKIRSTPNKRKAKLLVAVLILAIVAAGGWYFAYGPGKDMWIVKEEPIPAITSTNQTVEKVAPTPENWQTFTSKEIGISFEYPTSWKPTASLLGADFSSTGEAWRLSLNTKTIGYVFSADWTPAAAGSTGYSGEGKYNACLVDETSTVEHTFYSDKDTCIKAFDYIDSTFDADGSPAARIVLQKKLELETGEILIEITPQSIGTEGDTEFTRELLVEKFKDQAEDLERFAKSVKIL